jgi:hypothetical protein
LSVPQCAGLAGLSYLNGDRESRDLNQGTGQFPLALLETLLKRGHLPAREQIGAAVIRPVVYQGSNQRSAICPSGVSRSIPGCEPTMTEVLDMRSRIGRLFVDGDRHDHERRRCEGFLAGAPANANQVRRV